MRSTSASTRRSLALVAALVVALVAMALAPALFDDAPPSTDSAAGTPDDGEAPGEAALELVASDGGVAPLTGEEPMADPQVAPGGPGVAPGGPPEPTTRDVEAEVEAERVRSVEREAALRAAVEDADRDDAADDAVLEALHADAAALDERTAEQAGG